MVILSKVLLLLSLFLGADAHIKAPETAPVGQYFLVDGLGSVGTLTWSVPDKEVSVFTSADSTSIVLFCPSRRRVKVRLTATDAAGKSVETEVIDCGGSLPAPKPDHVPAPLPTPAPKPTPSPDPVPLPDGRFKIAQQCREHARQVKAERAEQRRQEAEQLAVKLSGIRDRIKSGDIDANKPAELMAAVQAANAELPRDVQRRWSLWGSWWGRFLYGLVTGGTLQTAADWILIIEETILGLRSLPSQ